MSCVAMNSSILSEDPRLVLVHSRSPSRTSTASYSSHGEGDDMVPRISTTPQHRQRRMFGSSAKKAKRIRFFRNGDRFFKGVVMPVTPERYRSFDSLLADVTHSLKDHVTLPNGVRNLYTIEGAKVGSVDDLEDGKCYVCSGQGESFKKIEYLNLSARKLKPNKPSYKMLESPLACSDGNRTIKGSSELIRPKVVTLVRNGTRPRKLVRLLLNKRNAPSFDHVLSSITDAVKLDTGAVRKVFTASGAQALTLQDFFRAEDIFFVYGSERYSQDDFHLDADELRAVQAHKKNLPLSRRVKDKLSIGKAPPGTVPKTPRKVIPTGPESRETDLSIPSHIRMKYKVGNIVGDGNFAVVRRCTDRLRGGEFAMKIIDKSKCEGREQMIENEVNIMRKVRHPNIVRLFAEIDTPTELYLIMELEGGDLFDAIAASIKFPEEEARLMITHLASALAYLHQRDIVHRDIKPENLLVQFDENQKLRSLKLGDFGLAQHVVEPLTAICGTPTYVAPEILCEAGYGLKVDVWAAGVILYILLCGFPPFVSASDDQDELFDRILSGIFEFTSPFWDPISSEAKDLISSMLQGAPEVRFSAEDVLDHPWLHIDGSYDELNTRFPDTPRRKLKGSVDSQNMDFSG